MSPTIRGVVFDMDDVLCAYDFDRRMAHMAAATGLSADFIRQAIWDSGFDEEADEGKHDAEAYLSGCRTRLGMPLSREAWVAARSASMTPDHRVLAVARAVARKVPIALLTNNGLLLKETMPDVFPEVIEIFGDRVYFSAELGFAKPDPRVFNAVAERMALDPTTLMFIDDSADYAAGARRAGLHAHVFGGAEALENELAALGLL
jgi:putative hydrolase of the HAD superfamily